MRSADYKRGFRNALTLWVPIAVMALALGSYGGFTTALWVLAQ